MSWRPQPLGQPNLPPTPLERTAADLIGWLSTHPCTQQPVNEVFAFQRAWNDATPNNPLVFDGKYGPLTRGALQSVMARVGSGTAPADCFTPAGAQPTPTPAAPTPAPVPPVVVVSPAPAPTVVAPPSSPKQSAVLPAVLIGAGVATAGYFGYLYWKKNKRRR